MLRAANKARIQFRSATVENVEVDLNIGQTHIARSTNKFQDLIAALASAGYPAVIDLGGVSPFSHNKSGDSCCCG